MGLGGSDHNCQNGSNSTQAKTGLVDGKSSWEPAVIADPGDADLLTGGQWSVIRELQCRSVISYRVVISDSQSTQCSDDYELSVLTHHLTL